MEQIIATVINYFSGSFGKVELAGTVFSLICVWLAAKQNIWTWFWGLLGVICFGYLFFQYRLYSDALLQILFYLPMQVIGFLWWRRENIKIGVINSRSLTIKQNILVALGVVVAAIINGYLMFTYTDASFPYLDALTTWMSIAAQILMIKRYWQSWVLWVSMDCIAIFVYAAKGLIVTSGLYVLFLILATYGLFQWYGIWNRQNSQLVGEQQ